jgi:hypothetical protein
MRLKSAGTTDAAKSFHEWNVQAIPIFLLTNKIICACLWHYFERIHLLWSPFIFIQSLNKSFRCNFVSICQ